MKTKKRFTILLALMLLLTCIPISASAASVEPEPTVIDLLELGTVTLYDPDGNIVPTPRFVIGEGIGVPANHLVVVETHFYVGSPGMDFYASVTGGSVTNLHPNILNISTSEHHYLSNFTATSGSWYGKVSFNTSDSGYHQFKVVNEGTTFITIDSLTGVQK